MKGIIVVVIVAVILLGGGYVLYTLNSGGELDEVSPFDTDQDNQLEAAPTSEGTPPLVNDSLDSMDEQTRAEFDRQVAQMQTSVKEMADTVPSGARLVAQGKFERRIHSVTGTALLIDEGEKKTLRFEDFETDNGPNLHIYLAADLGADDFIDLGPIKATKGNVNYEVDASIDTTRYNKVLIWCVPFRVLFSYAALK